MVVDLMSLHRVGEGRALGENHDRGGKAERLARAQRPRRMRSRCRIHHAPCRRPRNSKSDGRPTPAPIRAAMMAKAYDQRRRHPPEGPASISIMHASFAGQWSSGVHTTTAPTCQTLRML